MEKMRGRHEKDFCELHRVKPRLEELEAQLSCAELENTNLLSKLEDLKRKISEQGSYTCLSLALGIFSFYFDFFVSSPDMDKDHGTLRVEIHNLREQITKTSIENSSLRANEVSLFTEKEL